MTLFICYSAFSQSEKEIATDKIKTETEMISDDKSGIETYHKESYTAYDQNGNTVEEIQYNDDGSIKEHKKYTYNASNLKTEETEYDAAGKLTKKTAYTYDAKGNKVSKVVTDGAGKTKQKKKYVYTYYE